MATKKKLLQAAAGTAAGGGSVEGAWTLDSVSIGSYGKFITATNENFPQGVFFKTDGTKMYVCGPASDGVQEYNLSTAWDISTASHNQGYTIPQSPNTSPTDVFFKSDGTIMYIMDQDGYDLEQYSLSTAWDVSTASYSTGFNVSSQDSSPQAIFFKSDGTKMYMAGIAGVSVYEYNLSTAWNVSTATYSQSFSVNTQEPNPSGVHFKSDGTKMYIVGYSSDNINEYSLSTAWDVSTASYSQAHKIIEESTPRAVTFKPDGTRVYICGNSTDAVYSYTLSTAWDISTTSWDGPANSYKNLQSQDLDSEGIFFKPDGTKLYYTGRQNDSVYEYNLSTAWDVSTATYSQAYVITEDNYITAIFFKSDGTKMYATGGQYDAIYEYNLSTSWDVSTASYSTSFSVATEENNVKGLHFKPDGTKIFITGEGSDAVWAYNLSTAWDLSTASIDFYGKFLLDDSIPEGIYVKPDGTKFYIMARNAREVHEYSLSTAYDFSTASYSQSFSVAQEVTSAYDLFFKSDGTAMYIVDYVNGSIWQYSLSTAWDISTASASTPNPRFYTGTQDSGQTGGAFKSDGTKMYSIGTSYDKVYEYNLSTAWDVTTATYSTEFSIASQETTAQAVDFKTDGTKMYILGYGSDTVFEYNLSTAWDVSSASYSQGFSVNSQEVLPTGLSFKTDGTKMYMTGLISDDVHEYSLSTAWDVSTASLTTDFNVTTQEGSPTAVVFKSDGSKMYIVGYGSFDVHEYNLSTAWDVSTATFSASFDTSSETGQPRGLNFKSDGTKMYVFDAVYRGVIEYNLSTAWNVSTASFGGPPTSDYFDFGTNVPNPASMYIRPDGTKLYVADNANNRVAEYNLSTAWEVDTASSVQEFSVNSQETTPFGLFFKSDGYEMYVTGYSDAVYQYTLTTAWDISTASLAGSKSTADYELSPTGVSFKSDGTKMYLVGSYADALFEHDLSTAWDITTASYSVPADSYHSVYSVENRPQGIQLSDDGTKMFIVGWQYDSVYEYTLATAFDLTSVTYVQSYSLNGEDNSPVGIFFKSDGTEMFMIGNEKDAIWKYYLTPQ